MNELKQTINCCEYFSKMRHHFEWFSYQDDNGEKVKCMPVLKSCDGYTKLRINYCPSCGKKVREIELRNV